MECIPLYYIIQKMSPNKKSVKSVKRAVRILKSFLPDRQEMELYEIVERCAIPKSTVHRILKTLQQEGFIVQDSVSDKYKLGVALFNLGNLAFKGVEFQNIALPYLEELSTETGEAGHLGFLDKNEIVTIGFSASSSPLGVRFYIGNRSPLYCTGVGKATLAFQTKEKIYQILEEEKQKFTENTITEKGKLAKELRKIRDQGYAVDNMENERDIRCIAAPIRDYRKKVIGAVSVSGPSVRVTKKKIPEIVPKVKKIANQISIELGAKVVAEKNQ